MAKEKTNLIRKYETDAWTASKVEITKSVQIKKREESLGWDILEGSWGRKNEQSQEKTRKTTIKYIPK